MSEPLYVVWSEEHGAWWAPGAHGYTTSLIKAGRYSKERADAIVENANKWIPAWSEPVLHEVAMPDPLRKHSG
jgi:hypothetical protein